MRDPLLSPEDVAGNLGVSVQTLASWRSNGRYDLPYVKIGRLVRYRKSAIDDFISECDADDSDEDDDDVDDDDEEAANDDGDDEDE